MIVVVGFCSIRCSVVGFQCLIVLVIAVWDEYLNINLSSTCWPGTQPRYVIAPYLFSLPCQTYQGSLSGKQLPFFRSIHLNDHKLLYDNQLCCIIPCPIIV
jgi:hypothetical protein